MIIGIDHGYYAIKTRHCSFPAGLTCYGSHEPYTRQSMLEVDGQFYVCGTGRQPVRCDKTENDTYYLLTLAALAQEIKMRGAPNESSVKIAAGLPLTSFGRDKPKFRQYLLRSQPVLFRFEGTEYKIAVEDVALFPQGYAALLTDPDLLLDEPSLLLMDIGGWTVDLMRIDNARPVAETAHSLEFGMIRCIDAVREQVRRETGLSLTDAQIEQMLAGGPCALGDSVREIVRQQGRAYTERLFALVTEAGFDLRALPTVMLGGGAGIVQRHVGPKDGLCRAMFLPDEGERGRIRARVGAAFGPCERGVNRPPRPQFVFRPNLRCEDDRRAWQLLQAAPDGNRKALIVRALLQSEQEHRLEETVRRAVREELEKAQIAFAAPPPQDGKGIPKAALDFLATL